MMRFPLALVSLLLFTFTASAQTYGIGSLPNNPEWYYPNASPMTVVDYGSPARNFDEVGSATIHWSWGDVDCADAFKVKILRPSPTVFGAYTVIADEGPFHASSGLNRIAFAAAVDVEPGDVLAVTQLRPSVDCGGVLLAPTTSLGNTTLLVEDDVSGTGTFSAARMLTGGTLAAHAGADFWVQAGVITVAGSVAGVNGSNFRTSVQLTNPLDTPIAGYLVFHPAGLSAGPDDPALPFELGPEETRTLEDVIAAMGTSGLGSIDVWTIGSPLPTITTRVFNDLGPDGTLGFTIPLIRPEAAGSNEQMTFAIPGDLAKFRMNVGVRTLENGATLMIRQFSPTGEWLSDWSIKEYPPHYFEQVSLQEFIGGSTPVAGGSVEVVFAEGSAIVYASTTDNKTNDSSVTILSRPL